MPSETPQKPTNDTPAETPATPVTESSHTPETPVASTHPVSSTPAVAPETTTSANSSPAVPESPKAVVETAKSDKLSSPLPSALQPTDTPFNSLEQVKDVWQLIWKGAIWLNGVLAALFVVMIILKFAKLASEALSAVAVGVPFWLLPVLLGVDAAALGAYFLLKRPKLNEFGKVAVWVGISLAAVFITSITYVVVQSVS